MTKVLFVSNKPPYEAIAEANISTIPRPGDLVDVGTDGNSKMVSVSWISIAPTRGDGAVTVACYDAMREPEDTPDKFRDKLIDFNSKIHEKSISYHNLVLVAGYAGLFSIWGFVKDKLTEKASLAIAASLVASITTFAIHQVINMLITAGAVISFVYIANRRPAEMQEALVRHQKGAPRRLIVGVIIWAVLFTLALISASAGASLLWYNACAKIFGWPPFPK